MCVSQIRINHYIEQLGVLHALFSELETSCVSILGDWNADTSDRNTEFGSYFARILI